MHFLRNCKLELPSAVAIVPYTSLDGCKPNGRGLPPLYWLLSVPAKSEPLHYTLFEDLHHWPEAGHIWHSLCHRCRRSSSSYALIAASTTRMSHAFVQGITISADV